MILWPYTGENVAQTLLFMKDEIICSNMYNMEHTKRDFLNYNETINNEHTHIMQILKREEWTKILTFGCNVFVTCKTSVSPHTYATTT